MATASAAVGVGVGEEVNSFETSLKREGTMETAAVLSWSLVLGAFTTVVAGLKAAGSIVAPGRRKRNQAAPPAPARRSIFCMSMPPPRRPRRLPRLRRRLRLGLDRYFRRAPPDRLMRRAAPTTSAIMPTGIAVLATVATETGAAVGFGRMLPCAVSMAALMAVVGLAPD